MIDGQGDSSELKVFAAITDSVVGTHNSYGGRISTHKHKYVYS